MSKNLFYALNTTTPAATSPTIHYELTNHLGNVMAVITDEPAATETPAVESLTDYYPFGMTMPGRSYNAHTLRHGFTGHEKESDLAEGIYTTEYRLYDARVGRWLSVDPLFEKNIDASSYSYCHGNPVKLIDPDGRDEYEVDGTGYVTKVLENKEKDVVYSVDKKGNRVNSIEFNQRIIERSYSKKNSEGFDIHIIQMRGDDNATQFFEFLANPDNFGENREGKNVEWGLTMTGEAGEKGLNFLTTSHNRRKEGGFTDLYNNRLRHGYTIRKFIHNHPSNTPYPSGLKYRDADIGVANSVSKYTKGNASFSIYVAKSNTYINYDGNSLPEDFGFMPSFNLNEFVVTAHSKK